MNDYNAWAFLSMTANSSKLTCPSPSLSASTIMAWTCWSVRFSPTSARTFFRFANEIFPVPSSLICRNAFVASLLMSFAVYRGAREGSYRN